MKAHFLTIKLNTAFAAFSLVFCCAVSLLGQSKADLPAKFRVGERLSYNVTFASFPNVAYFETFVVSSGKFGGREAVELQGRIRTFDIVSAAFSSIDESRTVFASPDSGMPLYIKRSVNLGGIPKETVTNLLTAPAVNFDFLTMLYRAREAGGTGSFTFEEEGETFVITFAAGAEEKAKTPAGEFETFLSTVQSPYFDSRGIRELKVNFTSDEYKVPVLIRFRTAKGVFVAELSGLTVEEIRPPVVIPTPTPVPQPTPTPKPKVTPEQYVDNRPLLREVGFELGESLEYKVTSAGQTASTFIMQAKERKQIQNQDCLVLTANVTSSPQNNRPFMLGDSMTANVDPDTLVPRTFDIKFGGAALTPFNQNLTFDGKTGAVSFGTKRVDSPIGTHSLLSLIYAMRSFNLKPSKNLNNPVNDTRVAVFWVDRPYVFILRPNDIETITLNGEKTAAQMIAVKTGNTQLDALGIKIWLSTEDRRVPLRISAGSFQADLVSVSNIFNN